MSENLRVVGAPPSGEHRAEERIRSRNAAAALRAASHHPASNATRSASLAPAEAQLVCRAANEQIKQVARDFASRDQITFVCECSKPGCWEPLSASAADYEDVRRFPTRFLVVPSHASDETERIVIEHSGFVVVEKVGPDAELAIRRDPRRRTEQTFNTQPPDREPRTR